MGTANFNNDEVVADLSSSFSGSLDMPVESISATLEEWYKKRILALKPTAKILILFYQEYPKKMPTHDEVVDQIKKTLLQLGYNAESPLAYAICHRRANRRLLVRFRIVGHNTSSDVVDPSPERSCESISKSSSGI